MPRALLAPLMVLIVLLSLVVALLVSTSAGLSALTAVVADDDPYVCIRSHLILGEDNPICIHVDPGWDQLA